MDMRSTGGMRTFLIEQMDRVSTGDIELDRAKGVANLAQQVYNTINLEIKVAKARAELGEDAIKSVDFT